MRTEKEVLVCLPSKGCAFQTKENWKDSKFSLAHKLLYLVIHIGSVSTATNNHCCLLRCEMKGSSVPTSPM